MTELLDTTLGNTPQEKFLPADEDKGTALCLSGGGYRAALFHLGVCRRLNEIGLLAMLDAVNSVSGGSIFAAHLAKSIVATKGACFGDYESTIAMPFRSFVKNDVRTVPALSRLLPSESPNAGVGAEALEAVYDKHLLRGMRLRELPQKPRFTFCATDISFGVDWVFSRDRVGDDQAGYLHPNSAAAFPLARAVAASSCFPPVFRPMAMRLHPSDLTGGQATGEDRDECVQQLALSDGGIYDNMGLEPIWKSYKSIIVSDGGMPYRFAGGHDTPYELYRIHDIMAAQAEALRKRWLIAGYLRKDYAGAYLGIQNSVSEYPSANTQGYSKEIASQILAQIRTDMDKFSDDEIAVLENHGYSLADAAYRTYICQTPSPVPPLTPISARWWPTPGNTQLAKDLRRALLDSGNTPPQLKPVRNSAVGLG